MLYVFGDYTLDTQQYEVCHAGQPVHVRPKVFQVLAYLLAHRDRVVPKQELCEQLWPTQFISDVTLDSCIAVARRAVGDSGRAQRVIQTRHRQGYRFVAAVAVRRHPPLADVLPASPTRHAQPEPARGDGLAAAPLPGETRSGLAAPPVVLAPLHPPRQRPVAGEQKLVTVLVGTLAPAATWAQDLEPEALHQALQAWFALLLEEVQRYGGTLQRVEEDGVLALFGAPVAHEDHAWRAVLAALGLHHRLRTAGVDLAVLSGEASAVRLGLHTGRIVLSSLGDDLRLTYTSVGDTTQRAAWLAHHAGPGTILVSETTARLVPDAVRLEVCPPVPIPGQTAPSPVYEVLGFAPRRVPLLMYGARPLSRFVGRELELATLEAVRTRVEGGQGQVVGVVGEPGMGKTRLIAEFWQRLGATRVTYLEGRCVSYGQAIPYLPVGDLLRHACGLSETDSPATVAATVHQQVRESGMDPEAAAPYLLHLLGMPDAAARLAGRSPQEIRAQTFATLHQLLLQGQPGQPRLLVVENLHWIDPTSQAYLAEVVERVAGVPVLVLVTFRPGYRPLWMEKSYATQVALPRLRPEDSRCVVQAVLPATQLPEHLMQDILAKAAGNPLFLEELAWTVREHGAHRRALEVPDTVQAVLAARIDRLPPEAKALLQTAAVIGTEVPVPLVQAVAELPVGTLQQSLTHLQTAEFLYETHLFPEHVYTFKHALTQEVAYGSLLQERRRALHARIVTALEALAGGQMGEQVDLLAHHALRGEVWAKALAYCRQAGEKALARSAHREAVGSFEQALSVLPHLPETRDTLEQAIDLQLALRTALVPSGDAGRVLAVLQEAETLAVALDDPRRLGQVLHFLSRQFSLMGTHDQAITAAQRALALATAHGAVVLQALAHRYLGLAYLAWGDYRRALDHTQQAVTALDGLPRGEHFGEGFLPAVSARGRLAWCHAALGTFVEGWAVGATGLQIAEAAAHPASLMFAAWGVGLLALRQGDLPRALPQLERALRICQEADLRHFFPIVAAALGEAYTLGGRVADAVALLTQALEQSTAMARVIDAGVCAVALGEAQVQAGRLEEAHALAVQALALTRTRQERGHEAYALCLFGAIAAHRDPPEVIQAEASYHQALALADELGMRPLVAHCHRGLGTLYAATGQREQARRELATAIALYRGMEMTFWLPQTEAALAQVR